jgi:hypothetical protein
VAELNPAAWLQSRTDHPAILYRRVLGGLLAGHASGVTVNEGGIVRGLGDRLSPTGSASLMQVTVGTGAVFVAGDNAWQGVYYCLNDSNVTLNIAASHATQFRRDLVIAKVLDTAYGDGSSEWALQVVQGTNSASSPAPLPTQPATSELLAIVNVDPSITNLSGKVISVRRAAGSFGTVQRNSTITEGSTAFSTSYVPGTLVYDEANAVQTLYMTDNSSALKYVARAGGWTTYTPAVSGWGSATFTTRTGRYQMVAEKACAVIIRLVLGNNSTGSANRAIGLPFVPDRTTDQILPAWRNKATGGDDDRVAGLAITYMSGSGVFLEQLQFPGYDAAATAFIYTTNESDDTGAGDAYTIQGVFQVA